jgi:lysophospholipase L1-like esterase
MTANLSVLKEGIAGNRVLQTDDFHGPSALARFDRDVLAQAGIKYVIILEGINDIGYAPVRGNTFDPVTAEDLITGFSQLAARAHMRGIKIFVATITPDIGDPYYPASPDREEIREAVNQWIRTTNQIDGFIDFDEVTRDPARPTVLLPAYDSGDHLHPDYGGSEAMGDSIDLKLFAKQ